MSNTKIEKIYALRDKDTKKILRNTKCKGGSFYKQRYSCQSRCNKINDAYKRFNIDASEYEVGEYAVVDIDEWKELVNRI